MVRVETEVDWNLEVGAIIRRICETDGPALLDPSAYSLMTKPEDCTFLPPEGCSGLLIDATRKGSYLPVGLPKQEFMEQALQIWREEGLPPPNLKTPWYGYPLGLWTAEDDKLADEVIKGEYFEVGKKLK